MEFTGRGEPLTESGLEHALGLLGLARAGQALLWAVIEVETAGVTQGFGFRPDRRPQILFERHKFRDFTQRRFDHLAPELSGAAGRYGPLSGQYERLEGALALARGAGLGAEPALRATSWGMGQVMGFNHHCAGHASAADMVKDMKDGEDAQLAAMAAFLAANRLAEPLQRHDWPRFARGYNGRGYWRQRYDVKLAEQHARFASGSQPSLELRRAQAALLYLGHDPGRIDGLPGPRTQAALGRFCVSTGVAPGAALEDATLGALCEHAGLA